MTLSAKARWLLRGAMALGLAFIYVPLLIVLVNSFNADRTFAWPPPRWTLQWWSRAWENTGVRDALWVSVKAGLGATAIALVLGTMVAFAVQRYKFFGRDTLSLLVVLRWRCPESSQASRSTPRFGPCWGRSVSGKDCSRSSWDTRRSASSSFTTMS
jgi:ABC-type spermidine/putrescine transport system permease subunit II